MLDGLASDGYGIVPKVGEPDALARLCTLTESLMPLDGTSASRRGDAVFGLRNVLRLPVVRRVAESDALRAVVARVLEDPVPVRGILFDKTPGANRHVPWHQDLSLAVAARPAEDVPGWGPWSEKAGVVHVQPPAEFLERMLTVRLHLDPCPPENGALRVLPGTHGLGRLTPADTSRLRSEISEVVCACDAGDALLMRPLLLHASAESRQPDRRRVLHIEYAPATLRLPPAISWHVAPL